MRKVTTGIVLTLIAATVVVVGTIVPAAALNRCGLTYSQTTPAQSMFYDETPPIQPYRLRLKPSTPRDVCIEFLAVKAGWEVKGYIIRFYDYQGQPAAKIRGEVKVCRWHSDDDKFFVSVKFYARPKNQGADWKEYTGETVYDISGS